MWERWKWFWGLFAQVGWRMLQSYPFEGDPE